MLTIPIFNRLVGSEHVSTNDAVLVLQSPSPAPVRLQSPKTLMNPPCTQIRKRSASQQQQLDSQQSLSVLRRSARLQSKQSSISIPHSPRPCYNGQSLLKKQPTDSKSSYTGLPTSDLVEALQGYSPQSRKQGLDRTIENSSEGPSKRARLTERNLKAHTKLEDIGRHKKERKGSSHSRPKSSRTESKFFRLMKLINKWSTSQQHIEGEANEDDYDDDGYFLPPISQGIQAKTAESKDCDGYDYCDEGDEQDEPSNQLLAEYYASFAKDKGDDEPFVQVPMPDTSSSVSKPRGRGKEEKRSK